jgi:hypothetical protein
VRKFPFVILILFIFMAFFLHLLALMNVFPLLLSTPIMFISIFIMVMFMNDRKRFKGF